MRWSGVLVLLLAACAGPSRMVEVAPLLACPVVDGAFWSAGELPDGLPASDADAVLALYRAWRERGEALQAIRALLEEGRP